MESADVDEESFETPGVLRRSRSTSDNIRENPLVSAPSVYYSMEDLEAVQMNIIKARASPKKVRTPPIIGAENEGYEAPEVKINNRSTYNSRESTLAPIDESEGVELNIGDEPKEKTLFMEDCVRRVDFVLVYRRSVDPGETRKASIRYCFECNLEDEGLQLERADSEDSDFIFVKLHAPWEVLSRYADIMKLKMPMKEMSLSLAEAGIKVPTTEEEEEVMLSDFDYSKFYPANSNIIAEKITGFFHPSQVREKKMERRFTTTFSRDKEYLFDIPKNKDEYFTQAQRSQIVDFLLKRKRFSNDQADVYAFGIKNLLTDEVYTAAYPLHDGPYNDPLSSNMRSKLMNNWASVKCVFNQQPLDDIRVYFGVKIGLYFAWLGFYTYMLIPASIVGIGCFIYGCLNVYYEDIGDEFCNAGKNITMCPLCDTACHYWQLNKNCISARITAIFDNASTVFFSVFMSLWASIFFEMWKRYSAQITYHWDLTGFDATEEHPRPEYLARLATARQRKLNIITQMYEPHVPFWKKKLPLTIFSMSVVLLLVTLAVASVFGVILYRISVRAALYLQGYDEEKSPIAAAIVSTTAALINLVCILVFNMIYAKVAAYVTELEMPRTQTEYDNRLTLKMFMLQFVNYYSSIFYIAFFKGKFAGHPGDSKHFLGFRQEECSTAGCLFELTIQLAIIMVGKQAFSALMEMVMPWLWWLYNTKFVSRRKNNGQVKTRAEEDLDLVDWGPTGLFFEYLEMILQFGFVTIFVAAFPLAPLFALLNNSLEIRLDARKLITSIRRPVAQRVKDIGVWYRILDSIGKLAVLTNALIIAFTSNVVPRIYYRMQVSSDGSLDGFLNHSLAYFNVSDYPDNIKPSPMVDPITNLEYHPEICRYHGYRHPPWHDNKYESTEEYWHITAAKFAFVVVFENVVAMTTTLIRQLIPDMPRKLREKIRQENYLISEIIIEQELRRAKEAPSYLDLLRCGRQTSMISANTRTSSEREARAS